jgi:hypothetical protein
VTRQGRRRADERGARGAEPAAAREPRLKEEREILSKAAAWFATGKRVPRSALRVREGEPGHPSGRDDVPTAVDLEERVLRVGAIGRCARAARDLS